MKLTNLTEEFQNCSTDCINSTSDDLNHHGLIFRISACALIILIALAAFFGNLAVVIVSYREEKLRHQTGNFLIVVLSSIDVLTSIFVIFPSAATMAADFWPFGIINCRVSAMFNYVCACSSSHAASMISFDRAIAIFYPLKYQAIMTPKFMIGIVTWLLSNSVFLLMLVVFFVLCTVSYNYNEAVCAGDFSDYRNRFNVLIATTSCFIVPAIIVIISNVIIVKQIRNSSKVRPRQMISLESSEFNQIIKRRKDMEMRKSVYSMMTVIAVFFICYTPYALTKQGKAITDIDAPAWLKFVATIMMFISSATNPFIYGILRKDYRDGFKKFARLLREKFY
ncbi:mu-type opioid receptor-like [Parasteatoda tepidariorum]|uniref:mu-type opioid receptor-like n=1 Tax=Parasteatoda tepidariorum TaxID=114398 RepID=UPI001C71BADA|nr:mu-type opioid receptor-like [Parasteatoda tepidariorum]